MEIKKVFISSAHFGTMVELESMVKRSKELSQKGYGDEEISSLLKAEISTGIFREVWPDKDLKEISEKLRFSVYFS